MRAVSKQFTEAWIVATVIGLAITLPIFAGNDANKVWLVIFGTVCASLLISVVFVIAKRIIKPERWFIHNELGISSSEYHDIIYLARHSKLPAGYKPETVIAILEHDLKANQVKTPWLLVVTLLLIIAILIATVTREFPYSLAVVLVFNVIRVWDFQQRILPKYSLLLETLRNRL